MLIQKTLHVNRTLEETKSRIMALPFHRQNWEGLNRAEFGGGKAEIAFDAGLGIAVEMQLEGLPSDDSNELLFHSCSGNVAVDGMIEFSAVQDELTEVTLTIDYAVTSPLSSLLNRLGGRIDRFLNEQLSIIEPILRKGSNVETAVPVYTEASPALSICLR